MKIDSSVLTPKQIENLEKLADYAWNIPEDDKYFDMDHWAAKVMPAQYQTHYGETIANEVVQLRPLSVSKLSATKSRHECGTVCCLLGLGPFAGIEPTEDTDNWRRYASANFTNEFDTLYVFLFHHYWKHIDNSPKGGAKRIHWFLENGMPLKTPLTRLIDQFDSAFENYKNWTPRKYRS